MKGEETRKGDVFVWRGSNLPNNVAAGLYPVVQEGEASVGDEIGETHDCRWIKCVCCVWRKAGVVRVMLQFVTREEVF